MTKSERSVVWAILAFIACVALFSIYGLETLNSDDPSFTNSIIFIGTGFMVIISVIVLLAKISVMNGAETIEKKKFICPCKGDHYDVTIITGTKLADHDASLCKACILDQISNGNWVVF